MKNEFVGKSFSGVSHLSK